MTKQQKWIFTFLVVGGMLLLLLTVFEIMPASGQGDTPPTPTGDNSYCLICHSRPDQSVTLPDGSVLNITVTSDMLADSVHGTLADGSPIGCVDCHGEDAFPHSGPLPASAREFRVEMSQNCANCHTDQAAELADGVHYEALAAGDLQAATCVDCHTAHQVQPPDNPVKIAETCGSCHEFVYNDFQKSIHGEALLAGDTNVPTCINCHGVHGIQHPTTAEFRNNSPELCATCHADKDLMAQYGITTNVFNSYLSDFHGTTVALFEAQDPDVATNKAVCYDCHGVHDIAEVNQANSHVIRENLLETCQQCHPDATSNFPDAWIGHYPPTLESHPLLFSVKTFYKFFIPTVIGGFVVLISTDLFRAIRQRSRKPRDEE